MTPILYIIMRNDIGSMNPGKAMAQASHASNAFVHHYLQVSKNLTGEIVDGFREWQNSTSQGFGTVVVLEGKIQEIKPVVDIFRKLCYITNIVHDPTYPLMDGKIVHHISIDTCAYIFVPNKENDNVAKTLLKCFSLHR
jgi:peptidyl-tRNA hydrolase